MTRRWLTALGLGLLLLVPAATQGGGNCTVYRVFIDGEVPTVDDWNNSFAQAATTNSTPVCVDDHSASVGAMQTQTDPYPSDAESLPTSLAGEIERLRYQIRQLNGRTYWYQDAQPGALPNLLANASVESWSAGASAAPDRWTLAGAAGTIARNNTAGQFKHAAYSASVTRAGTNVTLSQNALAAAGGLAYIAGRTYTAAAWVRATAATTSRLSIDDGVGQTYSTYHTGGSTFEYLTVTRTLSGGATGLTVRFIVDTTDTTSQVDALFLSEGYVASVFTPSPESILGGGVVPYARVYNSLSPSIGTGVWTRIGFDSERQDTRDMHDPSGGPADERLVAPVPGFYAISCTIRWAASATGERGVAIQLNEGLLYAIQLAPASISMAHHQTLSTLVYLAAGQYAGCATYQTSGGPLNVTASGNDSPEFSIAWLAP